MSAKLFNPQVFLEFLCYSVFSGLIFFLVKSGKYLSYVAPRMEPYLYFLSIVMGIWALMALGRLFRPQHKIRSAHCFILVIPILLLLLPHKPLSASDFSGNYASGNALPGPSDNSSYVTQNSQTPSDNSNLTTEDNTDSPEGSAQTEPSEDEYYTNLPGLDTSNKKITISNDDFGLWYYELYANIKKYDGYTIIMTGFVFKDPSILAENEFVPARLIMSCCVADLTPGGIVCRYDKIPELNQGDWVTVEGSLFIGKYEYNGTTFDEPQVNVTKITPAQEVKGYVYPY